jgi:hypothetical protein
MRSLNAFMVYQSVENPRKNRGFSATLCYYYPMYKRNISKVILESLSLNPVVFLSGARQVGKSTLVQSLLPTYSYLLLDEPGILITARTDPQGFVDGLGPKVILDEVQVAPEIISCLKNDVDRKRNPGRFMLTGSANVLVLPKLSESLAGRMDIQRLYPLSQAEILGVEASFIDWLFGPDEPIIQTLPDTAIPELIARGGFPEAVQRSPETRASWFRAYLSSLLQKDVRDLANIRGLVQLPNLVALLAARNASLLNIAELSRSSGLAQSTLSDYLHLLEALFLIVRLPAWSKNLSKRLVKTPKLYLLDTGLNMSFLNVSQDRLSVDPNLVGGLLEQFIVLELYKQLTWSQTQAQLYHFRLHAGQEVDIVLEGPAGEIIGIEIKSRATLDSKDIKGLEALKELTEKKFYRGIILYTGDKVLPFGSRVWAMPVSALWSNLISKRS